MPHIYSRNVPAVSTTLTLVYTTYVHGRDRELVTPDEHPGRPVNSVEIHISYTVKQRGEESPKSAQCEPFQRAELVSPFLEQCFLLQEGGDGFKRVTCVTCYKKKNSAKSGHHGSPHRGYSSTGQRKQWRSCWWGRGGPGRQRRAWTLGTRSGVSTVCQNTYRQALTQAQPRIAALPSHTPGRVSPLFGSALQCSGSGLLRTARP